MANKHPILIMTKIRAYLWREKATDEDFMKYIDALANIYAARKRQEKYDETGEYELPDYLKMFKDYKEWLEKNG